jgi:uncharacterized protein with HEPN domain
VSLAAADVAAFVSGRSQADFAGDRLLQAAVERKLSVIGEAVKRLSAEFRSTHCEMPWQQIAGLRDVLVHEYDEVRSDDLWHVATTELPALKTWIDSRLPPGPAPTD